MSVLRKISFVATFTALLLAQPSAFSAKADMIPIGHWKSAQTFSLDGQTTAFGSLTNFTVSLWIRPESPATASQLLFAFSDGTTGHRIQMEVHQGKLHFGWQNGGSFTGFGTDQLNWTPGTWYHVVFVNDHQAGKMILRSNDAVWKRDASTLAPAELKSPVSRVSIGSLHGAYVFNGGVKDVQLFDRALTLPEQFALHDAVNGTTNDARRVALIEQQQRPSNRDRLVRLFHEHEAPRLSSSERQRKLEWLFQLEDDDLLTRTGKEIGWTRAMIERLQKRAGVAGLADATERLQSIERNAATSDVARQLALYFDIRELKRRVMFTAPELDFTKIVCVDAPYSHRSPDTHGTQHQTEWVHESRFRSEMCATHGARLVVLENFAGDLSVRQVAPPAGFGPPVAMLGFDVSFDGRRVLFCMKPENEKAYHLYEIGLDGTSFRPVTAGGYSDIDPVYLPDGRYLFLSTRAEVYAQCGMWARSHIMTRCDADGSNIYILSPASEPDFSPALLADGRVLFTRWEYVDKFANRIQALWTIHPDGTAMRTFWGNQSVYPDHLGEARQIPGSGRVMFTGFGHHDVWVGSIGIVDPSRGLNFPNGIWKVTQERPWPEVGDGPVPTPGATAEYHTAGRYAAYKTPYPLSGELFLVSARTGDLGVSFMQSARERPLDKFKLFLMDIYGNRELLYAGDHNVLYAQPVRAREIPQRLPDVADLPGPEKQSPAVRPGVFFSNNIFEGAPPEIRAQGRYLRIVESMPKNYSIGIVSSGGKPFGSAGLNTAWGAWGERFLEGKTPLPTSDVSWGDSTVFSGPATSLTGPLGVKQVHGTVPIGADGSVCFQAPPCRMLYFQVLDEHYRAIHTMRSWVSVRPGEHRGCVGCHEQQSATSGSERLVSARNPHAIQPPPWGVRSLSYVNDIQPIFDRACAECHSRNGQAVGKLDLTLRPDAQGTKRWGGIFPEPYLTLLLGKDNAHFHGACPGFKGDTGYVAVPNTLATRYDTLPPLSCLSPKSRLITEAMNKSRCGQKLAPDDLQMLIAWIDLWAMFRSDDELRAIEDPPAEWFPLWTYPPKTKTAPRVRAEYAQDEYRKPEDRLKKR